MVNNARRHAKSGSVMVAGALEPGRLASYHKLQRESQVAALKSDVRARVEENRKQRVFSKAAKEFQKRTGRS